MALLTKTVDTHKLLTIL